MLFADLVRKERKRQGLLFRELAARSSLGEGYLSSIERGDKTPSIRNAIKIAKGLGLNIGVFSKITDDGVDHGSRTLKARRAAAAARRR